MIGRLHKGNTEKILEAVAVNPLVSGVTFSGGEPFCQPEAFYQLALGIRKINPELDILSFTGYTLEELQKRRRLYRRSGVCWNN